MLNINFRTRFRTCTLSLYKALFAASLREASLMTFFNEAAVRLKIRRLEQASSVEQAFDPKFEVNIAQPSGVDCDTPLQPPKRPLN